MKQKTVRISNKDKKFLFNKKVFFNFIDDLLVFYLLLNLLKNRSCIKKNEFQQIERVYELAQQLSTVEKEYAPNIYFDYSDEPKTLQQVKVCLEFSKNFHPMSYLGIYKLIEDKKYFDIYIHIPPFEVFRLQNKPYAFTKFDPAYLFKNESLNENIHFVDENISEDILEKFSECKRFALDIETFGNPTLVKKKDNIAEALDFRKGNIRLIQIGIETNKGREALILDLGGWNGSAYDFSQPKVSTNENGITIYNSNFLFESLSPKQQQFLKVLEKKLFDKTVEVLGANLKFDLTYLLHHLDFRANNLVDVMLVSQIYWSGVGVDKAIKGESREERSRISHGLLAIAERLGFEINKTEQNTDWGFALTNSQLNYAASDVFILFDIWDILSKRVKAEQLSFSMLAELAALPVFVEMEVFGTPVDVDKANELLVKYIEVQQEVLKLWNETFPEVLFTENEKALAAIREKFNLDIEASNKKELKVLEKRFPWITSLLQARTLNISINYIQDILRRSFVNEFGIVSVASTFFQIKQGWRSSSKAPNLQNSPKLPKEFKAYKLEPVRKMFAAPPGHSIVIKDASGCHARIATEASQDPTLKSAYNANKDQHLVTAIAILASTGNHYDYGELYALHTIANQKKKDEEPLSEEELFILEARDRAKTGFYSFLNQAGKLTMQMNFKQYGFEVPIEECVQLKSALNTTYNVLYKFILKQVAIANSFNYQFDFKDRKGESLSHEIYGMIRGITGGRKFCKKEPSKFREGQLEVPFTDTIAFMWLSSEASMLKMSLGIVRDKLLEKYPGCYICNFQHDEMDILVNEEVAYDVAVLTKQVLNWVMGKFIKTIPVDKDDEKIEDSICKNLAGK